MIKVSFKIGIANIIDNNIFLNALIFFIVLKGLRTLNVLKVDRFTPFEFMKKGIQLVNTITMSMKFM